MILEMQRQEKVHVRRGLFGLIDRHEVVQESSDRQSILQEVRILEFNNKYRNVRKNR